MEGPLTLEHGYNFLVSLQKQRALLREVEGEKNFKEAEKNSVTWKKQMWVFAQDRLIADGID